jgi:integrase
MLTRIARDGGGGSMVALTKRTVDALKSDGKDAIHWDDEDGRFGLRITANGVKSYVIQYRNAQGRSRRLTIGRHGPWTAPQARTKAFEYLRRVDDGQDPAENKRADKAALTISQLCDEYMEAARNGTVASSLGQPKKASTLHMDASRIAAHVKPLLGNKPVKDLTQAQVRKFYEDVAAGKSAKVSLTGKKRGKSIVAGGPTAAKRCVGLLGGMMTFAVRKGYRAEGPNPAQGIGMVADRRREFRLEPDGWRAFELKIQEAEKQGVCWQAATIARLLALTGCRKEEIASLRWDEVDFDNACFKFGKLANDDSRVKSGTIRPIGKTALALLDRVRTEKPTKTDSYVFPGISLSSPYQGLAKAWKRMGIGFPPHCLRHAVGSAAENDCGLHESTVAALLGHKKRGSVTRGYILKPDAVLLAAADKVSGWIALAMDGPSSGDVMTVHAGRVWHATAKK